MKRYRRFVIACMLGVGVLVWFVPSAAETVENLLLAVLAALTGY